MASLHLPVPGIVNFDAENVSTVFRDWKQQWIHYSRAVDLTSKSELVQVSTLLTCMGNEARRIFDTFEWENPEDQNNIEAVLQMFEKHIAPLANIPFERFSFNIRNQEPGESFEKYVTQLRLLARNCEFENINSDEILRDRILFGMKDVVVRKKLLMKPKLTLQDVLLACRTEELSNRHVKALHEESENVHAVNSKKKPTHSYKPQRYDTRSEVTDCKFCGNRHERRKESCPAWKKTCNKCGGKNHFRLKCTQPFKRNRPAVNTVFSVDSDQSIQLDDELMVTLRLQWKCKPHIRFQIDNGSSVNIVPLHIYKKASGDMNLERLKSSNTQSITAYGNRAWSVLGEVIVRVWRKRRTCLVRLLIVEGEQFHCILGRNACIELGCLEILDNDALHKPETHSGNVFATQQVVTETHLPHSDSPLSTEQLKQSYKYTPGKELYVADTLSRAYLPNESVPASVAAISEASSAENLAMSANRLKRLRTASRKDASLQHVAKLVQKGWPARHEVTDIAMPYYSVRSLLTLDNDLLFKDNQLVVPSSMRDEMMDCAHKSHGGIGACLRRMRECIFWPGMSKNMKERISTCEICLSHADSQMKEPIIQHDIGETPWSKIGADLCELHGRMLLVVTDYYSNFISVKRLNSTTTTAVSKQLMELFSVHGIPKIIMTDNATQFSSFEFKSFTSELDIEHITSSPHYPQSNGKAENAVKTVKRLFSRCRDSGYSEYLALLDFNNTPTEGVGLSPSQRLFGRRCRTSLPVTKKLLRPRYSTEHERKRMTECKQKQARYYKSTRQLPELSEGETVRVKCPGEKTWTKGTCVRKVAQRSYDVQAENATYRRNRRHILTSKADSGDELPPECATTSDRSESESSASVETYVHDDGVANDNISDVRPDSPDNMFLRRSARVKHQTPRLICEKD